MRMGDKIIKLHEKIINICNDFLCTRWKNSWQYDEISPYHKLKYYFLVYMEQDYILYYNDIQHVEIKLQYDKFNRKYRIDAKIRNTDQHNFWYFKEKDFQFVEEYILKIIRTQYKSISELYSTFKLCNDAYNDVEPTKMYKKMIHEQRSEKLKKIM